MYKFCILVALTLFFSLAGMAQETASDAESSLSGRPVSALQVTVENMSGAGARVDGETSTRVESASGYISFDRLYPSSVASLEGANTTSLLSSGYSFELQNTRDSVGLSYSRFSERYAPSTLAAGGPPPPRFDFFPFIGIQLPILQPIDLGRFFIRHDFDLSRFLRDWFYHRDFRLNLFDWVSPVLGHLPPHPGPTEDFVEQEALTAEREKIFHHYERMATQGDSSKRIAKLLPSPDEGENFLDAVGEILSFLDLLEAQKGLSATIKFRFMNAKRTLNLMKGDESIEHHPISSVVHYSNYSYSGMPTIGQLLVLGWRLAKPDSESFVEATLAEEWKDGKKWRAFQSVFMNTSFGEIVSYGDAGQALSVDREQGRPLVKAIADTLERGKTLPVIGSQRLMQQFMKRFLLKQAEQAMPLIESLFMVMRGHNPRLLDSSEPNIPACAEGAYLGLLRAVSEMVEYQGNQFMLIINDCALAPTLLS